MFAIDFLYPSFIKPIKELLILETTFVFISTALKLSKKKNSIKMNPVICKWFVLKHLLYLRKLTLLFTLLHNLIAYSNSDSVSFCGKTQEYQIKIRKQIMHETSSFDGSLPSPWEKLNLYPSKIVTYIKVITFLQNYLLLMVHDITKIKWLKNES